MGAGKSTVGRILAERWGVTFRDTDDDLEAAEGRTISDIFVDSGEEHFRTVERDAVTRALAEHDGVLAVGGGAGMAEETRAAMAGAPGGLLRGGPAGAPRPAGPGSPRPPPSRQRRGTLNAV